MKESPELKAGDRIEMHIGGQTLLLKPIPYGRLKELLKIVFKALEQFSSMSNKNIFLEFPKIFEDNLPKIMPLMFDQKEHSFMNAEWVDENLSIVDMREIIEKMVIINGLQDFLAKMGAGKSTPAPKPKVELTPAS